MELVLNYGELMLSIVYTVKQPLDTLLMKKIKSIREPLCNSKGPFFQKPIYFPYSPSMVFSSKGEKHGFTKESHINFVNHKKASPLHLAVQSGDLDMIKMCLDNGAHIDMIEASVQSVWHSDLRIPIHYFPNVLWLLYTQLRLEMHIAQRNAVPLSMLKKMFSNFKNFNIPKQMTRQMRQ